MAQIYNNEFDYIREIRSRNDLTNKCPKCGEIRPLKWFYIFLGKYTAKPDKLKFIRKNKCTICRRDMAKPLLKYNTEKFRVNHIINYFNNFNYI